MSVRHAFGVACALALGCVIAAFLIVSVWYLLVTSPPLGFGLLAVFVLIAGATWGMS